MSKQVAEKKENKQMAISEEMPEWLNKGDAGNDEMGAMDVTIPRLDVIQAISDQLKKQNANFIEGAQQGDIFNTVTSEIYGTEIVVVPVYFRKEYIIWKLRNKGGGMAGFFKTQEEAIRAHSMMVNADEHEIVETHQHFCLLLHEGKLRECVISMAKSKLKCSRTLNSLVQMSEVDRFAKAYRFNSVEATSNKGDYWTFKVTSAGFVPKEIYDAGKKLYESIKAGQLDMDRTSDTGGSDSEGSAEL